MLPGEEPDISASHEEADIRASVSKNQGNSLLLNRLVAGPEAGQVFRIEDTGCNGFGIIKDVKINNIVAADSDKTEQFQTKNFKQIFCQSPVNASVPPVQLCDI